MKEDDLRERMSHSPHSSVYTRLLSVLIVQGFHISYLHTPVGMAPYVDRARAHRVSL